MCIVPYQYGIDNIDFYPSTTQAIDSFPRCRGTRDYSMIWFEGCNVKFRSPKMFVILIITNGNFQKRRQNVFFNLKKNIPYAIFVCIYLAVFICLLKVRFKPSDVLFH